MLHTDLYDCIMNFRIENGKCLLNGKVLGTHEEAFINYYYIKYENPSLAKPYIFEGSKHILSGQCDFHYASFWLWVLGEYINTTADAGFLNCHIDAVWAACKIIKENWDKKLPHWLSASESGFFISNLSIAYGALLSISNSIKSDYQKLLVDISNAAYEKYMNEGRIVSESGFGINGDLSVVSVPFALLDAGNQIMVESISLLEKELKEYKVSYKKGAEGRDDLTLLLSWYYAERGEIGRAKKLLHNVLKSWKNKGFLYGEDIYSESNLSYILFAIAKKDIESKSLAGNLTDSILLKHIPYGFQNPYRKENCERSPYNPVHGGEVVLNLTVEPFLDEQDVYVAYKVRGSENKAKMTLVSNPAEEYYTVSIGPFEYGDTVEYNFETGLDGAVKSQVFSFEVGKWLPSGNLINYSCADDHILLTFDGLEIFSKYLHIKVNEDNKNCLKFEALIDDINFPGSDESFIKCSFKTLSLKLDMEKQTLEVFDFYGEKIYSICVRNFMELLCDSQGNISKIRYDFDIEKDEKFFGMGERFSHIEYRGHNIDNYVYNQYRDQGLRTYIPVPFTVSSRGYGIHLDTAHYSVFKFDTVKKDVLEIETEMDGKNMTNIHIFFGLPKEVISNFVKFTGYLAMVPKWCFGPWMSSHNWDSQKEVMHQASLTQKYGIPATALVIEAWSDEATFYIFNDAQYEVKSGDDALRYRDFKFEKWGRWPDPKAMVDSLHEMGIRVLLWQAPVMKYMDGICHAQRDEDERAMLRLGFHVKKADGSPYRIPYYEWFKGSLVPDFTNEEAVSWWLKKREYLLDDVGIDGFKTDGGEGIYGFDTVFSNGMTGASMRNLYPNLYIKAFHDFANKKRNGDSITFSRAGYTGSQTIPVHWAGDERSTFEAFRSSIRAGLSSAMSGLIFWGWDIAGFNGEIPTAELYIRATEMAVFCPIMQYHAESKGEFNRDRTPWNIAERTNCSQVLDICRDYANLRMNLLPYIYNEAIFSVENCVPMMRPMFLEYPSDFMCIDKDEEYFFGGDLLVAPVVWEGHSGREVYLPYGRWCSFFDGEEIWGGRNIYKDAKLSDIPVFIRENSIIPLNLGDSLKLFSPVGNCVDRYKNLTFLIYVTGKKTFEFIDDLGNNIKIIASRDNNNFNVELSGHYNNGDICLIFRCMEGINNIMVNGMEVNGLVRKDEIIVKVGI